MLNPDPTITSLMLSHRASSTSYVSKMHWYASLDLQDELIELILQKKAGLRELLIISNRTSTK